MKVGVIANPESGKDIRRIVSDAFTFNNYEKLNVLKRIVRTAISAGKTEFLFMPESFGFGRYIKEEFGKYVEILPFAPTGEEDTEKAARILENKGVCCIVVLGGDGTHRLVAKGITKTPLIAVSTGTNNAFPAFYEGTSIGLAISAIQKYGKIEEEFLKKQKRLEFRKEGKLLDIALVDIAISKEEFVGSKAVLDTSNIKELFVSFAEPGVIGLSSIFAYSNPIKRETPLWGACTTGEGGFSVLAPVMPGSVERIGVKEMNILPLSESVRVKNFGTVAALDGERKIYVKEENYFVKASPNGPLLLDVKKILGEIPLRKIFVI